MIIIGVILLAIGCFIQSWLFVQCAKDELQRPLICSARYFVFVTLGLVLLTGTSGALLIGIGSHWLIGLAGFVAMVILAYPGGLVVQRLELAMRIRMAKKLNKEVGGP